MEWERYNVGDCANHKWSIYDFYMNFRSIVVTLIKYINVIFNGNKIL